MKLKHATAYFWISILLGLIKILGTENSEPGAHPYMVAFIELRYEKYFCAGSLITTELVISAADCFFYSEKNGLYNETSWDQVLVIADADCSVTSTNDNRQIRKISKAIMHPDYSPEFDRQNICAVYLNEPFFITPFLQMIKPSPIRPEYGDTCWMVGWGTGNDNKLEAQQIMQEMNLMPKNRTHFCYELFPENEICTMPLSVNFACGHFSGGALVCSGVLAGVAVKGFSNCSGTVFSDVAFHMNFIFGNIVDIEKSGGGEVCNYVFSIQLSLSSLLTIMPNLNCM